jgi:hypothetical protein
VRRHNHSIFGCGSSEDQFKSAERRDRSKAIIEFATVDLCRRISVSKDILNFSKNLEQISSSYKLEV